MMNKMSVIRCRIGIALFGLLIFGCSARAQDSSLILMREYTVVSPKGTYRIEQLRRGDWDWQIWVRDLGSKRTYQLKDAETEPSGYGAQVYFSPDEQHLMRTQKTGSGDNVAILYKRGKDGRFHDTSSGEFFDSHAWDYFDNVLGFPGSKVSRYHTWTHFLGWAADSETFGIELSARHLGEEYSVYGWRVHYSLKSGKFFLTTGDKEYNKKEGVHWKRNGKFE